MSKESFYFSHDYNSRTDDKIKNLIRKHGMAGYGVFWCIIEDLYNNANAMRTDYEGIAYDLRTDVKVVESIINDFELFIFENGSFGSVSIERRLDERNEKSEKARQSAFKRWNKKQSDANAMRTHSECNAIKDIKDNKEKKEYIEDAELNSLFLDFLDMRKKIKKPATDRAIQLLLNDLSRIKNKKGAIELSIKKNYQGLFEPKEYSDTKQPEVKIYQTTLKADQR